MNTSPSYRPCEMCEPSRDCDFSNLSSNTEPCWGEVQIEVDFGVEGNIHACRGHELVWSGTGYVRESVK